MCLLIGVHALNRRVSWFHFVWDFLLTFKSKIVKISYFKPSFGDLKKRLNQYNPAQYLTKLLYNIIEINIRLKVNSVLAGMNNQGTNIYNFTNLPVLELFYKKNYRSVLQI